MHIHDIKVDGCTIGVRKGANVGGRKERTVGWEYEGIGHVHNMPMSEVHHFAS